MPVKKENLLQEAIDKIKTIVCDTLRIPFPQLDSSKLLESYGIDSILIVQLTNALGKVLPNITSTLFFEYQTIGELTAHLMETRKEALLSLIGSESVPAQKKQNHSA